MKKFLLLLLALPQVTIGQISESPNRENTTLIDKIYYDRNIYIAKDEDREKLTDLVFSMRADSTFKIHIIGYGDKWGGKEVNDRFSYVRAMYIAEWMRSCRVPKAQITYVGEGIDTSAPTDTEARRVEIRKVTDKTTTPAAPIETTPEQETTTTPKQPNATSEEVVDARAAEPIEAVDTEMQVEPETTAKQTTEQTTEQTSSLTQTESPEQNLACNKISLRTNLFYWAGGLMNIGAEYKLENSNIGFILNAGYSPFSSSNWERNLGGWFIAPEVRYYIPNHERWFVGVQFLAGGYDIKVFDIGRQGTLIGGGVLGGYRIALNNIFDMDFTLGLGYGQFKYDSYRYNESTGTNDTEMENLTRNSIIPVQGGINLIWKIK